MRHAFFFPLAALAALHPACALSAKSVEIAPSSPWNVDFGADKCRLARIFGEGDNRHIVFFEQYGPDDDFGMTVAGPAFKKYRSKERTELRFSEGQEARSGEPFTGTVEGVGVGVIYSSVRLRLDDGEATSGNEMATRLPQLDVAQAAQVQFVALNQRGNEVRMMTGPLDDAFAVLNQCTQSLVGDWGLDVDAHLSATRLPRWINADAISRRIVRDYPTRAVYAGEQGIMRMRVIIDKQGKVEECTILKATQTDSLESPACKAMQDARFEPAVDGGGQPMRSYYSTSIVYRMGD